MSGSTATQAWITGVETVELRQAQLDHDATCVLIAAAIALVAGDPARLEPLVTAVYPVEQAAEAFAAAAAGSEIKVQVPGEA